MQYDAVVISCGAAKIETDKPVQAWRLYTGGYYKIMLNLAIRMSKNVYILSAGYGLLRLNDMVETYDLKMDKKRAKQFKKLNHVQYSGGSLLGREYKGAVLGDLIDIIPDGTGGMGLRQQYAVKLAKERPEILVDLEALEDGIMRTFVPQEIN